MSALIMGSPENSSVALAESESSAPSATSRHLSTFSRLARGVHGSMLRIAFKAMPDISRGLEPPSGSVSSPSGTSARSENAGMSGRVLLPEKLSRAYGAESMKFADKGRCPSKSEKLLILSVKFSGIYFRRLEMSGVLMSTARRRIDGRDLPSCSACISMSATECSPGRSRE